MMNKGRSTIKVEKKLSRITKLWIQKPFLIWFSDLINSCLS